MTFWKKNLDPLTIKGECLLMIKIPNQISSGKEEVDWTFTNTGISKSSMDMKFFLPEVWGYTDTVLTYSTPWTPPWEITDIIQSW